MSRYMTQFTQTRYHGFSIQNEYSHYSWYEYLLTLLERLFKNARRIHRTRTLTGRLDFTFPVGYTDSTELVFSSFIAEFVKMTPPEFQLLYFWVREQTEASDHPHYHLLLFLSKEKKRSLHKLYIQANALWCKHIGIPVVKGYVQENRNHAIRWKDGDSPDNPSLCKAFHHAVYICKCKEKERTPKYAKLYGYSQLTDPEEKNK